MLLILMSLLAFVMGLLPVLVSCRNSLTLRSKRKPLVERRISESDLDGLFGPTPGGELEWAYGVLERAEREEQKAKRQEFIKRCKEAGHGELHEITTYGSAHLEYVCNSCGDTIYKLRFEEKRGGYPWPKEIAPLDVPAEWLTLGLLVDPTLVTEWTKGKQEEGESL